MWRPDSVRTWLLAIAGITTAVMVVWLGSAAYRRASADAAATARGELSGSGGSAKSEESEKKADKPLADDDREVSEAERADALARAHVWQQPDVPIAKASLAGTTLDEVSCRFKVSGLGGTTPKFDCELESGEEIRIKYGNGPEVPTEAAATRLLKALGFAADDITIVRKLRCYGCPKEPFSIMKTVEVTRAEGLYEQIVNYDKYEEFHWVALERKLEARPIETDKVEGWSFFELDRIDPQRGAPRAHVDAVRLLAVFLAHWDNKSENQRIVCLTRDWKKGTPCPEPFLMLQDVGATFGPAKLDLAAWEQAPVWSDRRTCTTSMRTLPFEGATFGTAQITERGRKFAAQLLSQLSSEQLTELFTHARFAEERGVFTPTHAVTEWVRVFTGKVRQISAGSPCPLA